MQYKIILESMPSEPRWEFDFHQSSDQMAIEFTERLMAVSTVIRAAQCNVALFCIDRDGGLVSRFKLTQPTVARVVERN